MAKDKLKCPFCGSEEIMVDTPYLDRHGDKILAFCCNAQKKNHDYIEGHFDPRAEDQMKPEEVSKL
jgi:hypothetical protein